MIDFDRLKSILSNTKLQSTNNALWQIISQLIEGIREIAAKATASAGTSIKIINSDTTTAPQTIVLASEIDGLTIIKDFKGNAGANNITLTGTVDGVVNPVINANYGVKRVYAAGGQFLNW